MPCMLKNLTVYQPRASVLGFSTGSNVYRLRAFALQYIKAATALPTVGHHYFTSSRCIADRANSIKLEHALADAVNIRHDGRQHEKENADEPQAAAGFLLI